MIPTIDISANASRTQEILDLNYVKYNLLLDKVEAMDKQGELSWQYFDYMIEIWQIQKCLEQKRTDPIIPQFDAGLMYILNKKLKWMKRNVAKDHNEYIKNVRQYYFTDFYIKEGYFGLSTPQNDDNYQRILIDERMTIEANRSSIPKEKIEQQIRIFYITQELKTRDMAQKKTITKQDSDRMIEDKVKDYNTIIDLLKIKVGILQRQIDTNALDELETVNAKLEIIKIRLEIQSKTEFRNRYRDRKNVIA
jgi:hypothetical protein